MAPASAPPAARSASRPMDDSQARRLRIGNALLAAWFVFLACLLGVIADDVLAAVLGLALFSGGYTAGVLWTDQMRLLPQGKLVSRERRMLYALLCVAAVSGIAALVLAFGDIGVAVIALASCAAVASVIAGVLSTWLAIR